MTFSIIARDSRTGALGIATATGGPVVGSLVPHARAGVGAIATQGTTNALFGVDGLDRLAAGEGPDRVLESLLEADAGREARQCILMDRNGRTASWTGRDCGAHAGAHAAPDIAVAGNLLTGEAVLTSMLAAYRAASGGLEDRLLAAMQAGEAAGGDRRGTRSAALKVYTSEPFPAVDLRADWSLRPVADLERILAATRDADYADFFSRIPTRANPSSR